MRMIRTRPTIRPLIWSGESDTRPLCVVRACPNRARYVIELRVVKDGRERRREEHRCIYHGTTFARRRGLEVPPVQ